MFQEKRLALDARRRRIAAEQAELGERQQETNNEYEQEKKEIFADIEEKETAAGGLHREIRNRTIDLEVEVKRTTADEERVRNMAQKEKQEAVERSEEFQIELK